MVNQNPKAFRASGTVIEALPSTNFKVKLDDGREVFCHLAGRLRMFRIKILPGDRVQIEMTPYDETKGRIVYRGR
ncbi:MAG: translation initiation factor IF-1 [bacterium]